MNSIGTGGRIDKDDLKKILQEKGYKTETSTDKKKSSPKNYVISTITLLIVAAYYLILCFGKFFIQEDNLFFLSLNVFSDVENPNRPVRIIGLVILFLSLSKGVRFIISRMAKNAAMTKRASVALFELLGNVVKYLTIVLLVCFILNVLGMDTSEILAGLGILSLILGLGVTSLVEDIVAGIFIIAENLYDVGDIVVVDDFRGTVLSIGLRSTQIEDEGGDILILRNSAIENLVNMTDKPSYAICDIPVNPEASIIEVEKIIASDQFESIRDRIPDIEYGPVYLGLSEVDDAGIMILTFVAVCPEDCKYGVQRMLNRELKILFENNEIVLGANDD